MSYTSFYYKIFSPSILFSMLILSGALNAQRDAIPSSAGSFGKFIDVPVSHYTGVPNISVPLHTISEGPISVPISLQYHSSGIKVGELASEVGLGWQLMGGGMVSRTVQSIPDEMDKSDAKGYYKNGVYLTYSTAEKEDIADLKVDGEPDIFHFYAPGLSGQFVFNGDYSTLLDRPTVTIIPDADLVINPIYNNISDKFQGFEITNSQGTTYIFGYDGSRNVIETRINESISLGEPLNNYTSGWYLLEIRTHDNKNSIVYNYDIRPIYKFKSLAPSELKIKRPKSSSDYTIDVIHSSNDKLSGTEIRYNLTTINGARLISIESRTSKIEFDYFQRKDLSFDGIFSAEDRKSGLETIRLLEGTGNCFEYQLHQSYYTESGTVSTTDPWRNRLKLDGLQKISCDLSIDEPSYVFTYYSDRLPHRLSKSFDHWGYNNGKLTNNTIDNLIPPTTLQTSSGATLQFGSSNRNIDEVSTKQGILTKITYPTSGSTEFTYEGNKAGDQNEPGAIGNLFDVRIGNQSLSLCQTFTAPDKTVFLDDHKIKHGRIKLGIQYPQIGCGTGYQTLVEVRYYLGATYKGQVTYNNDSYGELPYIPLSDLNLESGNSYTFKLRVVGGRGYMIADYLLETAFNTQIGGLRIKQIKTSDELSDNPDIIRNFYYRKDFLDNLSSGIYVGKPLYGYEWKISNVDYHAWAESYSQIPLSSFEGYHVGYERIEEELNGHGTKVITNYVESFIQPNSFPARPVSARIISGNTRISESFNAGGTLISKSEVNGYEPDNYYNTLGLKIRARRLSGESFVPARTYNIRSRKPFRPKNTTNTVDGVSTTTDIIYGDNENGFNHLQPFQITTDVGDGIQKRTKIWHSENYAHATSNVLAELRNRNILTLPTYKQHYIVIGGTEYITGGEKTFFAFFDGSGNYTSSSTNAHPYPWKTNINEVAIPGSGTWRSVAFNDKYNMQFGFVSKNHNDQWSEQPTTFTYDTYGNLLEKKEIKKAANPIATSVGLSTTYTYHPASSLVATKTQNDGQSLSFTYDGLLRPKRTTDNCMNGAFVEYDYVYKPMGSTTTRNYVRTRAYTPPKTGSGLSANLYTYRYMDGLGRTIQTVAQDQGPGSSEDIVNHQTYNRWGQVERSYEPFKSVVGSAFVQTIPTTVKYTESLYYTEPQGRLEKTKAAGWPYYTTYDYGHNVSADGTISIPGGTTFSTADLAKTKVTDGNGNISYSFTDKRGRTILKRRSDAADANDIDTYYDYDDKDRLSKVYPPGSTISTPELLYTYAYNKRDQTIEKKVPGKAKMEYRYSTKDLLKYSREGYLKSQNKWYAYQYDDYGREAKSGFYNYSGTPGDLSASAATISEALTENIYGVDNTRDEDRLITAKTKILGSSTWLTSTSTYDNCGRVTGSTGNNHLYNNTSAEVITSTYDWANNVLTDTRIHKSAAADEQKILNTMVYDHAGRNIQQKFKLNAEDEHILSNTTYDHKNQIIQNQVGKVGTLGYLQTVNYDYLENGLLDGINKSFASTDLFHEKLYYTSGASGVTEVIQKNGNIAAVESEIRGATAKKRVFGFRYDHLDRMTWADYYDTRGVYDDYKIDDVIYDNRGNIKSLRRRARISNGERIIDDLTYAYSANTNKLLSVSDAGTTGYKDRGYNRKNTSNYTYDTNGNVKYDPSRGVTFTYNHLDLPVTADFGGGKTIEWLYDAGGGLLTKTVKEGGTAIDKRDYVGGIEYKDGVIDVIYHGEGRLVNKNSGATGNLSLSGTTSSTHTYEGETITSTQTINSPGNIEYKASSMITLNPGFTSNVGALFYGHMAGGPGGVSWEYQYTLSDHLGNTRVVYADGDVADGVAEIVESYDYYPFGLKMDSEPDGIRDREAYQYNGIEYVEDHGLNYNMATYRCLDPAIGRWLSVDPYAESFNSMSPYNAMGNSPIMYADPEGGFIHIVIGAAIGGLGNLAYQGFTGNISSIGDGFAAFGIGAVAGGVGAATGGASLALTGAGTTFAGAVGAGALAGAVAGAPAGFIQNTGNSLYFQNSNLGDALGSGLQGAAYGALSGAVLGGITGGVGFKINNAKPQSGPGPGGTGGTNLADKAVIDASIKTGNPIAKLPDGTIMQQLDNGSWVKYNPSSPFQGINQAYTDLVRQATNKFGGNVTVQKNGIDLFRVHQPTSGHKFNVTEFVDRIRPSDGKIFTNQIKNVPVSQKHFDHLRKAWNGVEGYLLRTKGGR